MSDQRRKKILSTDLDEGFDLSGLDPNLAVGFGGYGSGEKDLYDRELTPIPSPSRLPERMPPTEGDTYEPLKGELYAGLDRIMPSNPMLDPESIGPQRRNRKPAFKPILHLEQKDADRVNRLADANESVGIKARENYEIASDVLRDYRSKLDSLNQELAPATQVENVMLQKIMDQYASQRRRQETTPEDAIGSLLLGLGGGIAGGMSNVPNSGPTIAKMALDAKADAQKRRERIVDDTPEVKALLSAMKLKSDRKKDTELTQKDLLKATTDTLKILGDNTTEGGRLVRDITKDFLIGGADVDKNALDKLKLYKDQKEKKDNSIKDFGKEIQPMTERINAWKALESAIGNGFDVRKLSSNPEENKAIVAQMGNIPINYKNSSWLKDLDSIRNPSQRNKAARIRAAIENISRGVSHEIFGASSTGSEEANKLVSLGQGVFTSPEAVLAALAEYRNAQQLAVKNIETRFSNEDPETKARLRRAYPYAFALEPNSPSDARKLMNAVRKQRGQ